MKKPTVECSRCHFRVEGDDPNYEDEKKKHVYHKHTEHTLISERDGSKKVIRNLDIGEVKWITVW